MTQASVFDGLVRGENSYTQLLYNLLKRDEGIRTSVLTLLLGAAETKLIDTAEIHTQKSLPKRGVPDLWIEGPRFSLLVEVKTENSRGRTAKQLLNGPDDDPDSYLSYLAQQKHTRGKRGVFVFLVPPDWEYIGDVTEEIEKFSRRWRSKGIEVSQLTWLDILKCHEEIKVNEELSLWQEFQNLLKTRFEPIRLSQGEVKLMIDGKMTLSSAIKLNKLLADIQLRAKKRTAGHEDFIRGR